MSADPKATEAGRNTSSSATLFRDEVVEHHARRELFGPLVMTAPVKLYWLAVLAVIVSMVLIAFLTLVSVPRVQDMSGYLDASQGVIDVGGSGDGILRALTSQPGMRVAKGDPLFHVEQLGTGAASEGSRERTHRYLLEKTAMAGQALKRRRSRFESELGELETEKANGERKLVLLMKQEKLLEERAQTMARRLERFQRLRASDLAPGSQFDDALIEQQEAAGDVLVTEREIVDTLTSIEAADYRMRQARDAWWEDRLANQQARLEIEAEINELVNKDVVVVEAPVDGLITAVNVRDGQRVDVDDVILRILPDRSELMVRFPVPSAAVGLIQAGQDVQLRYRAFPYQKYGVYQGKVTSVSPTAVATRPPANGADPEGDSRVFMVEADPILDHVIVAGQPRPLLPEMAVDGAVILEHRTILEWFLEPLLAIRGRL